MAPGASAGFLEYAVNHRAAAIIAFDNFIIFFISPIEKKKKPGKPDAGAGCQPKI